MDGPKPILRRMLLASLALAAPSARADDFIRQPSRDHDASQTPVVGGLPLMLNVPSVPTSAQAVAHKAHSVPALLISRSTSDTARPASPSTSPASLRQDLAARISSELLAPPQGQQSGRVLASLEPAPGWQAVHEGLKSHLDKCEGLLARHAYLSAREESNRAILQLVRVLDLRQNRFTSEPAWAKAQQALRESQDFTTLQRIANDSELFTRLIQSHETPVLRGMNVSELTPLAAAQHYRAYAESQLVEASQGHPWFSELYYCIGRTLQAQHEAAAEHDDAQGDVLLQQAMTYYRSAHTVEPTNATNASQLGYVLLRMDRPQEAFTQLAKAVRLPDCPLEGWQNLVQASSRLGDQQTADWATQNYLAHKARGQQSSSPAGTLLEVDPRQFAAMSPYTSGPRAPSVSSPLPPSQPVDRSPAPAPAARTASTPTAGFFR